MAHYFIGEHRQTGEKVTPGRRDNLLDAESALPDHVTCAYTDSDARRLLATAGKVWPGYRWQIVNELPKESALRRELRRLRQLVGTLDEPGDLAARIDAVKAALAPFFEAQRSEQDARQSDALARRWA